MFANILATTAFEIMGGQKCGYGEIIQNVIPQYINDGEMKHIYLMNPFLWEGLKNFELEDRKVTWLLIIPISTQEKDYARVHGWNELEVKLEEADIDIFNLQRKSIL